MKLQKHVRDFFTELKALCAERGGEVAFNGMSGRGHYIFDLRCGNNAGRITCASSPSDGKWINSALRNAEKVLKGYYDQHQKGRAV
jgi:hypothetical protein